ncbi:MULTISPECIES: hypothetical protein [Lysinibacillus]|uniref:hypothetical protein n=1 Tax=Lysinibacillus TaxID=400634 RepID=UPI0000F3631F|nr:MULTISPECIES: hypothetical protein [Lysinibacillus]EAZ83482.1 hypothetical protein BB14905_22703 [Bacillus sp. B14905]MED4077569.1 hypothetical protein [Lysinibacillus fusiformis]QTB29507.1 hypothetical protein J2D51_23795 [Lysinibacillus sphaericus]
MKLKHFLAIPIALIGLTYFTPQEASANTIDTSDTSVNTIISSDANIIDTSDEFLAKVKVYDANGEQIPYTTEELQQMFTYIPDDSTANAKKDLNLITPFAASTYNTNAFSFKSYIYVKQGDGFWNPTNLTITPQGTKAFTYHIINKDHGTVVASVNVPEGMIGGFHHGLSGYARGYDYSFKFENFFSGTVYMTNVAVTY